MKSILFLREIDLEKVWPSSWPLVFDQLEMLWGQVPGHKVQTLHFKSLNQTLEKLILEADIIVGLGLTRSFIKVIEFRNRSNLKTKIFLYEFGQFSAAGRGFSILQKIFRIQDVIITASEAQK